MRKKISECLRRKSYLHISSPFHHLACVCVNAVFILVFMFVFMFMFTFVSVFVFKLTFTNFEVNKTSQKRVEKM